MPVVEIGTGAGAPSGVDREDIAWQKHRPRAFKLRDLNDLVGLLRKVPYDSRAIETIQRNLLKGRPIEKIVPRRIHVGSGVNDHAQFGHVEGILRLLLELAKAGLWKNRRAGSVGANGMGQIDPRA